MPRRLAAIVNPRSAGGKAARAWPSIEARIGPQATRFTEYSGHATSIAGELLEQGFEAIIAVGGDGTISEAANAFLRNDEPVSPGACLGIVPFGTGGDFRRSLGIRDVATAVEVIGAGHTRLIDAGKITFHAPDGEPRTRYFINLASFGMGGEVAARAKNRLSRWSGKAAFLYATVEVFFRYRARTVRLALDGEAGWRTATILNIAVGNGRYHGGGMHICPLARLDDGLLEVTVVEDFGMLTLLKDLPVLYSDNVYQHPKAHHLRARRLVAVSDERVSIEVDGEPLGLLPVEISVLPGVLRVLAPEDL